MYFDNILNVIGKYVYHKEDIIKILLLNKSINNTFIFRHLRINNLNSEIIEKTKNLKNKKFLKSLEYILVCGSKDTDFKILQSGYKIPYNLYNLKNIEIFNNLRNLTLDFSDYNQSNFNTIYIFNKEIFKNLTKLTNLEINLEHSTKISLPEDIFDYLINLKSLKLRNTVLSDQSLNNLKELNKVILDCCDYINGYFLKDKMIENLNISYGSNNFILNNLNYISKTLKKLSINTGCWDYNFDSENEEDIKQIKNFVNLKIINIYTYDGDLDNNSLEWIGFLPNLKEIHLYGHLYDYNDNFKDEYEDDFKLNNYLKFFKNNYENTLEIYFEKKDTFYKSKNLIKTIDFNLKSIILDYKIINSKIFFPNICLQYYSDFFEEIYKTIYYLKYNGLDLDFKIHIREPEGNNLLNEYVYKINDIYLVFNISIKEIWKFILSNLNKLIGFLFNTFLIIIFSKLSIYSNSINELIYNTNVFVSLVYYNFKNKCYRFDCYEFNNNVDLIKNIISILTHNFSIQDDFENYKKFVLNNYYPLKNKYFDFYEIQTFLSSKFDEIDENDDNEDIDDIDEDEDNEDNINKNDYDNAEKDIVMDYLIDE